MVKQVLPEDEPKHELVELPEDGAGERADGAVVTIREDQDADALPPHAEEQEDGSVRLPLKHPRTLRWKPSGGGAAREEHYEALVLRRLTGADMRAIAAAKAADVIVVALARSSGLTQGVMAALFDRLDGADARAAGDVVAYFLGSGQGRTGR